jgi:hypothetical protein
MPRLKLQVVLICLILGLTSTARSDDNLLQGKKVIEWGWDEPDTKFIRQNIAQMEQFPFDGLVFHADSSKGGGLTWEMWGSRKFTLDEFNQAIDDLKTTNFERFTDRFLRVNVTPRRGHPIVGRVRNPVELEDSDLAVLGLGNRPFEVLEGPTGTSIALRRSLWPGQSHSVGLRGLAATLLATVASHLAQQAVIR